MQNSMVWTFKVHLIIFVLAQWIKAYTVFIHDSSGTALVFTKCLFQMSSNSSLQVSHPLEKPSAACPSDFRRGWKETFKVIPHPPS